MEERLTTNQEVVGSTPMWPSLFAQSAGWIVLHVHQYQNFTLLDCEL